MAFDDFIKKVNSAQDFLNKQVSLETKPVGSLKDDGFLLPPAFNADGNGLPSQKVPTQREGKFKRNIITWFIPEFGIVRMYVNPKSITYNHKKLIQKDKTKGGYTLQYWGEDLTTLSINGTTGSSGIEGINVLYEIYRAEQFAFDGAGLMIASQSAASTIGNNLAAAAGGKIGQGINSLLPSSLQSSNTKAGQLGSGFLEGILGVDSPSNTLAGKNIPTLAQLAFTVEMYYAGWVYRGFFESMTITESADSFALDYQLAFTVTQKRGYRVNTFPWNRSAIDGPSQYESPHSYNGVIKKG